MTSDDEATFQNVSSERGNKDHPILKEQTFVDRFYAVCEFLVFETLELANNGRRDGYLPSLVPRNVRWSISGNQELTAAFHSNQVMEFFYPLHQEEPVAKTS